ncbi:MAG: efflux transporter RND family MFP subunit [Limisphaerales bacterium]|nr:MAG: efflux transporter RND family MFP subunit [Limisphaerales bacterium]KAG0509737.1 MAG: efflux transporter RND family MFP subunit [Limisphaerales bacterium]TXT47591.1 MAG: efflux transporter RND family MFP subunit [Limisphaerales bacterium]
MSSPPKPKRRSGLRWFLVLLLLGAAGGGGWWWFNKNKVVFITVQTEKVARRNLTEVVVATGKIQPVTLVKISPEVSGEIIDLPVKEGQRILKGDLLLKIKPDFYIANTNSADASFKSSQANLTLALANQEKARLEFERNKKLFDSKLLSESQFLEAKTAYDVTQAQVKSARHQTEVAKAALDRSLDDLAKTTIYSPLGGTISKLNSQKGERVVGTATMAGTDVMTIADLDEMEARVDIGEVDVVLIKVGQIARLELDSFREKKFAGEVTEIANTAKATGQGTQQEATKFEVRVRVKDKEIFRPGMSVTAEVETRYRTNVLCVPIQSVTTRMPKGAAGKDDKAAKSGAKEAYGNGDKGGPAGKKKDEPPKPVEVIFQHDGDSVKQVPVKRGISDDSFVEIIEGVTEGAEVISGGFKAINRELEDGKKVKVDNEKKLAATDGK